jgi:hypothetical protein
VPLRAQSLSADEERLIRGYQLLSLKPILHCLNLAGRRAAARGALPPSGGGPAARTAVGWVSAVVEAEVAALRPEQTRSPGARLRSRRSTG